MSLASTFLVWFVTLVASMVSFHIGWRMGEKRANQRFQEDCERTDDLWLDVYDDEQLRP